MTLKKLFKLIVIFFYLINLLAISQIIIDKILRNLINTGKVTSFTDNILVRIEKEKEYNKIIKEVVRKLIENNLNVKYK